VKAIHEGVTCEEYKNNTVKSSNDELSEQAVEVDNMQPSKISSTVNKC